MSGSPTSQFVPIGLMLLSDVVEAVGRAIFENTWTGDELTAHFYSSAAKKFVVPKERVYVRQEEDARRRFLTAVMHTRHVLESGSLGAVALDPNTGERWPIVQTYWASQPSSEVFETSPKPFNASLQIRGERQRNFGRFPCRSGSGTHQVVGCAMVFREDLDAGLKAVADIVKLRTSTKKRSPTPKDEKEFILWASKLRNETGYNPTRKKAYEDFAKPRGLNREWAIAQRERLPPKFKRKAGKPKQSSKLCK